MASGSEYPPYVTYYGGIPKLFEQIKTAAVPPKFNQDFMSTVLGLKSSSFRAMIPLLKKLGFIDSNNVPTQAYRDYRDDSQSGIVMAARLREAYSDLFSAHEYAWKLDRKDLLSKLKTITGSGDDDQVIGTVASTFNELTKLANWSGHQVRKEEKADQAATQPHAKTGIADIRPTFDGRFGLSYTINLNLPATTEIEVFNAIFKSLRENLLREK